RAPIESSAGGGTEDLVGGLVVVSRHVERAVDEGRVSEYEHARRIRSVGGVSENDAGLNHPEAWSSSLDDFEELFEPARVGFGIRIQGGDPLAPGVLDADIASFGETEI